MLSICITQQPPPGYERLLHTSNSACLPSVCSRFLCGTWIFYCGNQPVAGITFLKPIQTRVIKTYLSKHSVQMNKSTHTAFSSMKGGGLILLPGNFSFPPLGAPKQLFSKVKDFQRLKIHFQGMMSSLQ